MVKRSTAGAESVALTKVTTALPKGRHTRRTGLHGSPRRKPVNGDLAISAIAVTNADLG